MNVKTLIGKDNYLFLINDSNNSLSKHCNGEEINVHENNNILLIIFPDKEVVCKDYLPEGYTILYRNKLEHYKSIRETLDPTHLLDCTDYYKTRYTYEFERIIQSI